MSTDNRLAAAAKQRIESVRDQLTNSLKKTQEGRPRAAETKHDRLIGRLMTQGEISRPEAEETARRITTKPGGPEVVQGDSVDFVGVFFFERGRRAARSVARVRTPMGYGTGFMVSKDLFVTNNHVIASAEIAAESVIEFDFEDQESGGAHTPTVFSLDPGRFFITDDVERLDFTLVAIGAKVDGPGDRDDYGYCKLSAAENKHSLGELANIIQHPAARRKEVVLRENRLVARTTDMLHYVADTEPGSSGSPVFNNEWQVVALHHFGAPSRPDMVDEAGVRVPNNVNEGVRASAIVAFLEARAKDGTLSPSEKRLLLEGKTQPDWLGPAVRATPGPRESATAPQIDGNGTATWRIPIEISIRIPQAGAAGAAPAPAAAASKPLDQPRPAGAMEKLSPDQDYRSRGGYRADFIDGFTVALPELSKRQKERAARNQQAARRANPFELKYRHFSVVMNAERKLAFFTACNIDGATAKSVNRTTGKVTPAKPGEAEAMEAAEASEAWFEDPRIAKSEQTPQKLYAGQKTYLDDGKRARDDDHLDRMFQRGHLVRRADPAWGSDDDARAADADTFHFTNCAPQVGFFNMGSADPDMPKSGGGRLWRALEDYVLANAIAEDKRVCVFTGPVFGDDDPPWRGDIVEDFRVPLSFWKIVVWSEDGTLAARAMLASQAGVLRRLPEAMREAFSDREAVADFVTSIAHVEKLTGLAFPPSVRKADQGAGERAMRRVRSREEIFGKKR